MKTTKTQSDWDVMTLMAAEMFGVRPEFVTREQRDAAKVRYHGLNYGFGFKGGFGYVPRKDRE